MEDFLDCWLGVHTLHLALPESRATDCHASGRFDACLPALRYMSCFQQTDGKITVTALNLLFQVQPIMGSATYSSSSSPLLCGWCLVTWGLVQHMRMKLKLKINIKNSNFPHFFVKLNLRRNHTVIALHIHTYIF